MGTQIQDSIKGFLGMATVEATNYVAMPPASYNSLITAVTQLIIAAVTIFSIIKRQNHGKN